jgi:hypothetical protein
MKVNQIVSEHKKGVRAMKYTSKTKGTVPVYGPDRKDAKLKPVKPVGTNEAITVQPMPGASQVVSDGKPIATTDAATANTIAQAAEKGQFSATDGNEKPVPEVVGGDGTDRWVDQISSDIRLDDQQGGTDQQLADLEKMLMQVQEPWEKKQIEWRITNQKNRNAPGIDMGNPVATGGQLLPVVAPRDWIKQNPNLSQKLPNDAKPPEMQTPGMLDRIKSLAGIK